MLSSCVWASVVHSSKDCHLGVVQHSMHTRRMRVIEFLESLPLHDTPAIPKATNVLTSDHLCEATGLHVADLDKGWAEEKDIRRVPCSMCRRTFPLDCCRIS